MECETSRASLGHRPVPACGVNMWAALCERLIGKERDTKMLRGVQLTIKSTYGCYIPLAGAWHMVGTWHEPPDKKKERVPSSIQLGSIHARN